ALCPSLLLFLCPCSIFLLTPLSPVPTLCPYTTLFRSYSLAERLTRRPPPVPGAASTATSPRSPAGSSAWCRCRRRRRPCRTSWRSEEHTSELQSRFDLVCRLLLEKQKGSVQRAGRQAA